MATWSETLLWLKYLCVFSKRQYLLLLKNRSMMVHFLNSPIHSSEQRGMRPTILSSLPSGFS